jgi:vancomycin aglycone glucosyltransferase
VQPILAVALELQALGHDAVLCVAPNFKPWVESRGVECLTIGPDLEKMMAMASKAPPGPPMKKKMSRAMARKAVPQSIRDQFKVLGDAAAKGCDAIVIANAIFAAGRSVAEARKARYAYVTYSPVTIPGADHPPPMTRAQRLPGLVNRLLWLKSERGTTELFGGPLNEGRAQLGLGAVQRVAAHVRTDHPWVAADPALMGAGDGAWFLPDPTPLPDELEQFLRAGEPPLYFGFGSMIARAETGPKFLAVARALGRRAIVLKGWAGVTVEDAGKDVLVIGDVSHQQLFPRVAAIVHHGGAGTTHAAARAGRPQVIVPKSYDQFFHAHRVKTLGIGATCRDLEGLEGALREALKPEKAAAAQALAGRIQLDGARRAAERLVSS